MKEVMAANFVEIQGLPLFLVVFLVLTVAMGIFSTRTARTINANRDQWM